MSNGNVLKVAENSKSLAKKYSEEGNFGRAFCHYLVALKLKPEWKPFFKDEFLKILCEWGTILDNKKQYDDLFKCYEQAVDIFPNNVDILNNLGAHLLRCGLLKEAAHFFRQCLTIDRHYLKAARNLENVSNLAVERWHFRMLNDQSRNEAYRKTIIRRIKEGHDRVLDLGTGTGILSIFAWEGQAREIYACESSPSMIETAEAVFQTNNISGIKLINKHSTDLQTTEDLSGRVSLLVTEIFDAGLLGENVLSTLSHAWENLLLSPAQNGIVIPFGATLYLTGIEFDQVSNYISPKSGGFYDYIPCNILRCCEEYDTRNLTRASIGYLTDIEQIFRINFNNPKLIKDILEGKHDKEMVLQCKHSGRLDSFAVWFDLQLDECTVISTRPDEKTNCAWDQAIFPLPRSRCVRAGQDLTVKISFQYGKLDIRFANEDGYEASEDVINMLNDVKLVNDLYQLVDRVSIDRSVQLLDCFPIPIFGLSFLISRREHFNDKLTCFVQSERDRDLIRFIAGKYNVEVECKMATNFENLKEKTFDFLLVDFVDREGESKDRILQQLSFLKSLLKPSGVFLPQTVTVMGQLIQSDWLAKMSKVINDDVTCGYKIGEIINAYQVNHFIDLDSENFEMTLCSQPFELFCLLDDAETVTQMTIPCLHSESSPNAMVYWFRIKFMEGCDEFVTNANSRYHQGAFLMRHVKVLSEVKFNVVRNDGLFTIEFL